MRTLLMLVLTGCGRCGSSAAPVDTADTEPAVDSEPAPIASVPISDVEVDLHDQVVTILQVDWVQDVAVERGWIEFRVEGEDWLSTPERALEEGEHSEVLLGLPPESAVQIRFRAELDDQLLQSEQDHQAYTGSLPDELLQPLVLHHDPTRTTHEPYLLGTIDVGEGWYRGPCWVFIIDRQGRYVWYREVPDSRLSLFAQVSADGTHLLYEGTTHYVMDQDLVPFVQRSTLDGAYGEYLELPQLGFTFDEIEDGVILYGSEEDGLSLVERQPDGSERQVWSCTDHLEQREHNPYTCYPNGVVYNPDQGSVFWSMYMNDTVVEIHLESGEVLRQFGQLEGGWQFDPADSVMDYQHYPSYTPDGTIIASTHGLAAPGVQFAREYAVDDHSQTLVDIWSYGDEVLRYASYGGEAFRLDNGNTFVCYGTGGSFREITSDRRTVWEVEFPQAPNSHLLGHQSYIDDLYALNRGPEED